jgi:hypothetical protein
LHSFAFSKQIVHFVLMQGRGIGSGGRGSGGRGSGGRDSGGSVWGGRGRGVCIHRQNSSNSDDDDYMSASRRTMATVYPSFGQSPPYNINQRWQTVHMERSMGGRLERVDQVLRPVTKAYIDAALFQYLTTSMMEPQHLEQAVDLMHRYEATERLVLLELAVW